MNNGFKTNFVEPQEHSSAAVIDEAPDEKLTAKALEDIHNTERLSGFGRFAGKMQNLFQASKSSQTKRESSHLKAAPIMMSAGLLLLVGTGLLFLLSKPESAVHSHFRQPTGLSGADDHRTTNGPNPNPESPVTESQLAGADTRPDTQAANRVKTAGRAGQDAAAHRFSLPPGEGGASSASFAPNQASSTTELQAPATVFVANSVPISIVSPVSNLESRQSDVQVPSGTEITAHTTNAISSGLESPVIAIVDRNVQFGDKAVIPQGARVIGYTAGAVKDRINVRFTSLILPNNREVTISALALMKDGSAGLAGKVQGSGHPVLATAARIGTGAAVVATEFAGQGSLNQPFSQSDYLRNQLAAEVASEGSHYSSRLQQPTSVPIVTVNTNQSIRIFLLTTLSVSDGRARNSKPAQQADTGATLTTEQNQSSDQALAAAQTAYIQALEAQLADMRAALNGGRTNGRR